jgi:dTDP-4-dehydrorhamnose reductase
VNKIVILGGKGMLGSELHTAAASANVQSIVMDLPEFHVDNSVQLEQAVLAADIIVNCAAYTAVDKAESEPDVCAAVNSQAVGTLGKLAKKHNKYVIHISTDFVFGDLIEAPQNETDLTNPLSVYGRTKLQGEQLLLESECAAAIIRVEWTYGKFGNNFISKILTAAQTKPLLQVVADQFGAPTHTAAVCRAIQNLIEERATGIYHFANAGYTSRYDVARFIVETAGINTIVKPCATSDFQVPAARPQNSRFDCRKIDGILNFNREHWQDMLTKFINSTLKR